jgi:hypothetical protein
MALMTFGNISYVYYGANSHLLALRLKRLIGFFRYGFSHAGVFRPARKSGLISCRSFLKRSGIGGDVYCPVDPPAIKNWFASFFRKMK